MSAQDKTGAPSGATRVTLDEAIEAWTTFTAGDPWMYDSEYAKRVRVFLESLAARAKPLDVERPESDWYALEHAAQSDRFHSIDDNAELHVVSDHDLAEYVLYWRGLVERHAATVREFVELAHDLDRALNGIAAVGLSEGAIPRLEQLVEQVSSQKGVQIVNMSDGMRVNFRAPDGRRATLFLGPLLDAMESNGRVVFEPGIADVMRAAIKAYPCAGDPLPVAADGYSVRGDAP